MWCVYMYGILFIHIVYILRVISLNFVGCGEVETKSIIMM